MKVASRSLGALTVRSPFTDEGMGMSGCREEGEGERREKVECGTECNWSSPDGVGLVL